MTFSPNNATRSPPGVQVGAEPATPRECGELVDAIALELTNREVVGMPPPLRAAVVGALAVAAGQLARAEDAPRLSELAGRLEALAAVVAAYDRPRAAMIEAAGTIVYGLALERWTP